MNTFEEEESRPLTDIVQQINIDKSSNSNQTASLLKCSVNYMEPHEADANSKVLSLGDENWSAHFR